MRAESKRPAWQTALNLVALIGWAAVLVHVIANWSSLSYTSGSTLLYAIVALEAICVYEVLQIAMGTAKGNLELGIVMHYTRFLEATLIMPAAATSLAPRLILLAWSITEVCRYPMYLLGGFSHEWPRKMRYLAPAFTFPLGVGAEAWAACLVCAHPHAWFPRNVVLRTLVGGAVVMVAPTNVIGGAMSYPALLRKALKELKSHAA